MKKKILLLCFLTVGIANAIAQKKNDSINSIPPPPPMYRMEVEENTIYNIAEIQEQAAFPGDLESFLALNTNYPKLAVDSNIQGTVRVKFVVEKDGRITNIQITRSIHKLLDDEALRVVKRMPKWRPGKHNGKPVRMSFSLPFKFQLE